LVQVEQQELAVLIQYFQPSLLLVAVEVAHRQAHLPLVVQVAVVMVEMQPTILAQREHLIKGMQAKVEFLLPQVEVAVLLK
jgi:hypothetical protein